MSGARLIDKRPPSIDAESLTAIRLRLAEKLRRQYGQSDSFIAETVDEVVDQAYIEYAEALERGAEIASQVGWLITTAERRAVDLIRRDSRNREFSGEAAETIIDNATDPAPSVEALAARGIEAVAVHEAVSQLSDEQRQAVSLAYWQELTVREAADAMETSTSSFLRRRDSAMRMLRARFGVDPRDPIDRDLRVEAGFAAAALLSAGGGPGPAGALLHHVAGAGDGIQHGAAWAWGKVRDFAVRVTGSVADPVATIPLPARVAGACATGAAAIICGAGVAGIGPGAALLHDGSSAPIVHPVHSPSPHRATASPVVEAPPIPSPPPESSSSRRGGGSGAKRSAANGTRTDSTGRRYRPAAESAVRSQSLESETGSPESEVIPETESAPVESGGGSSAPNEVAQEQFGLP
jgi:RNA polymerase sigma factor (sigma-70 family)